MTLLESGPALDVVLDGEEGVVCAHLGLVDLLGEAPDAEAAEAAQHHRREQALQVQDH